MDKLLEDIKARGFLVNNLFQYDDIFWQCNLRDQDGECSAFALGKTANEALYNAFKLAVEMRNRAFADILG